MPVGSWSGVADLVSWNEEKGLADSVLTTRLAGEKEGSRGKVEGKGGAQLTGWG